MFLKVDSLRSLDPLHAGAVAPAITYVIVNVWHVVIWAVIWATTGFAFFWPIFPAVVWGVFLAVNWWNAYRRRKDPKPEGPTEEQVRQEMDALRQEGMHSLGRATS
jgi:2TM domain